MHKPVRILEEAAQEASEAAAWYEQEAPGLGAEFAAALDAAIDVIEEGIIPLSPFPEGMGHPAARRLLLARFPYTLITLETATEIIVIAVAHQAKRPGYWRGRSHA